jgi:hypothetical protein
MKLNFLIHAVLWMILALNYMFGEVSNEIMESLLLLEDDSKPNLEIICLTDDTHFHGYKFIDITQNRSDYIIKMNFKVNNSVRKTNYLLSTISASEINYWLLDKLFCEKHLLKFPFDQVNPFSKSIKYESLISIASTEYHNSQIESYKFQSVF